MQPNKPLGPAAVDNWVILFDAKIWAADNPVLALVVLFQEPLVQYSKLQIYAAPMLAEGRIMTVVFPRSAIQMIRHFFDNNLDWQTIKDESLPDPWGPAKVLWKGLKPLFDNLTAPGVTYKMPWATEDKKVNRIVLN